MIATFKEDRLLKTAKTVYMEGKSFPEVYRYLIRFVDSDKAISTLHELKKIVESKRAIA